MRATIPALLDAAAGEHGDVLAIVDGDRQLTYGQLRAAAIDAGAALVACGLEPGDRVSIWAPNSIDWVTAFLGSSAAGATLVPINTRFKGIEAAEVLRRSGARILVTTT